MPDRIVQALKSFETLKSKIKFEIDLRNNDLSIDH